jgi:hypothetical protein
MILCSARIALRVLLGLLRYLVLSVRDLAGEVREPAGQLPVTPAEGSDLRVQLAPPQLQLGRQLSGRDLHVRPNTQSCALPNLVDPGASFVFWMVGRGQCR